MVRYVLTLALGVVFLALGVVILALGVVFLALGTVRLLADFPPDVSFSVSLGQGQQEKQNAGYS